jgi:hypothetical protein
LNAGVVAVVAVLVVVVQQALIGCPVLVAVVVLTHSVCLKPLTLLLQ